MIFLDGSCALFPTWHASVDIMSSDTCVKDREKYDDVRSISRMNMTVLDCLSSYRRVIAIHLVFIVLCCKIRFPR
jgi:hypothetical protein